MSLFTSFAVAGGSGRVGSSIVAGLLAAGAKQVTVLSRKADTKVPEGVKVKVVDINSVDSVAAAVEGVDVFISAIGGWANPQGPIFARASKAAGVKLHVPNEWSMDSRRIKLSDPIGYKVETRRVLEEIGQPALHVAVGVFPEVFFWPGVLGFDFPKGTVDIVGSPDVHNSFTTVKDTGAFLGKLFTSVPAEKLTALGDISIQGDRVTLGEAVKLYEASHPGKKLNVTLTPIEDAKKRMEGLVDVQHYLKWIPVAWAGGLNDLEEGGKVKVDNDLVPDWKPTTVKEHLATLE